MVVACIKALDHLVNPINTRITDQNLGDHALDIFMQMDRETFGNFAQALDSLLNITETGMYVVHALHEKLLSAQSMLFTSAAIRFAGGIDTSETTIKGVQFSLKYFAVSITKTTKRELY